MAQSNVFLIHEQSEEFGILTDAENEADFLQAFSFLVCEKVTDIAYGQQGLLDGFEEVRLNAIYESEVIVGQIMNHAIEIAVKFRGYKSTVKERREIYSGKHFPSPSEITDRTLSTNKLGPRLQKESEK